MAAWYDRREALAFLLDHGVDAGARDPKDGDTALHLAAHHGNAGLVALLLARGAPVNARDAVHGSSPLVWALHAWLVERRPGAGAEAYRAVVRMLVEAGAEVSPEWRGDPELRAALGR
jgi:ankyrin repeat protein